MGLFLNERKSRAYMIASLRISTTALETKFKEIASGLFCITIMADLGLNTDRRIEGMSQVKISF